ncbi:MAG: response regulator [Saprospiraceae bacterium]|nr:response regulator [Saprospiraceae bacterium]
MVPICFFARDLLASEDTDALIKLGEKQWSWEIFALIGVGLLIWNHLRGVKRKTETLQLEAKVALRTSQIQRDKRIIEQQAEALKALDAKKSAFFANISHELRTPLTFMLGPIQDVLDRADLEEQDERSLRLAYQHVNKMLTMINEILDLSKLDADQLKLEEELVEIHAFIERLLDPFISLAAYGRIDFQFTNELQPGHFYRLDAKKLERILSNLLSNALKFTLAGGRIQVKLQTLADTIFIEVRDNGIGIAEADLPFVFDRYYQSSRKAAYQVGGTGIGLALVKELTTLMGGEIKVRSREGKGTRFTLRIPYREKREGVPSPQELRIENKASQSTDFEQSPKENVPAAKSSTILVVEDHYQMRHYICEVLGKQHEWVAVRNGEEALACLEGAVTIDLIITDVMMAKMDGFALLQRLKEHPNWKTIPVIILTARANQDDRLRAFGLGAADYLLKPFLPVELHARVNNILSQQIPTPRGQKKATKAQKAHSETYQLSKVDEVWLSQLQNTVKDQMGAFDFTIDRLGFHMAISRRQLSRKVKSLTGLTVHQYVQEIKLNEAKRLLENQSKSTVKAIAYELGMKDVKHFSKLYLQRFGKRPSDFF